MKRILIVGATSGIGEGLARLYAERGEVKIGVMGRRSERLKDLCASRPAVFEAEVCDVTDTGRHCRRHWSVWRPAWEEWTFWCFLPGRAT